MLDKQDVKLGIEREKMKAAKMEAQANMMKAMNEASDITLRRCRKMPRS
jgi:hypothetical protein